MLAKSPSFTLSAVLILALGIGGTVSIVTLLDTLQFRPLAYQDAERVVTIWQRQAARPAERDDVSPADFLDWRDRARSFSVMAGVIPYSMDYTGGTEPEVLFGAQVTEGFFDAIGMPPMIGRGFLPDEHVRGARRAVVITYGFWQSRYAGDPNIINKSISMDGEPWTIVGVLPKAFAPQLLPRPGELSVWTPKIVQEQDKRIRASAWWNVVARLAPGVTLEQAQSEMDSISAALAKEYPRTNASSSAVVVPLREHLMGGVRLPLVLMLGAVVLVLGIGCANVASLLLARGIERSREFAIRSALGAGRSRLVRQLVAESLLLSLMAAGAGLALTRWTLGGIVAIAPAGLLRLHEAAIDGRILLFAAALTTLTAIAFGLIPALQFSRQGRDVLRERQSDAVRGSFRRGLVAAEVAIALVLLAGAGLLVKSFGRLLAVDPGFSPRGAVMVQVFASDRNGTPDRLRSFFTSTLDAMQALPGVQAAGVVSAMPFALSNINIRSTLEVVGRPAAKDEQRSAFVTIASPGYFSAMSIPLREGRLLEDRDSETAPVVAVISEGLRRREWPDESPVGRRVRLSWQGKPVEAEVVGVVSQIRHDGLDTAPRPEVFLSAPQFPFGSMTYVVRAAGEPGRARRAGETANLGSRSDAAGVRQCQCRAAGSSVRGAAAFQHERDVGVRPGRAHPLRERHLRDHQLHDHAADTRDRPAHGARRRWSNDSRDGAARGGGRDSGGADRGCRGRAGGVALSADAPLRGAPGRSVDDRQRVAPAGRRGAGGMLPSGSQGDASRPDHRAPQRMSVLTARTGRAPRSV